MRLHPWRTEPRCVPSPVPGAGAVGSADGAAAHGRRTEEGWRCGGGGRQVQRDSGHAAAAGDAGHRRTADTLHAQQRHGGGAGQRLLRWRRRATKRHCARTSSCTWSLRPGRHFGIMKSTRKSSTSSSIAPRSAAMPGGFSNGTAVRPTSYRQRAPRRLGQRRHSLLTAQREADGGALHAGRTRPLSGREPPAPGVRHDHGRGCCAQYHRLPSAQHRLGASLENLGSPQVPTHRDLLRLPARDAPHRPPPGVAELLQKRLPYRITIHYEKIGDSYGGMLHAVASFLALA